MDRCQGMLTEVPRQGFWSFLFPNFTGIGSTLIYDRALAADTIRVPC